MYYQFSSVVLDTDIGMDVPSMNMNVDNETEHTDTIVLSLSYPNDLTFHLKCTLKWRVQNEQRVNLACRN